MADFIRRTNIYRTIYNSNDMLLKSLYYYYKV